jgi:hypothetical protein
VIFYKIALVPTAEGKEYRAFKSDYPTRIKSRRQAEAILKRLREENDGKDNARTTNS